MYDNIHYLTFYLNVYQLKYIHIMDLIVYD